MTTPRLALLSFTAGASIAITYMAALAVRAAYTITKAHRWADFKRIR